MKKQARELEKQYSQMQVEMDAKTYQGSSGNHLVTVVINGHKMLKNITIKPECVNPQDVEGLQDLIIAAMADAFRKAEQENSKNNSPFGF